MVELTGKRDSDNSPDEPDVTVKKREWLLFLFLTFVLAPAIAVGLVGGYGFIVWMYQTIAGPPGPPV